MRCIAEAYDATRPGRPGLVLTAVLVVAIAASGCSLGPPNPRPVPHDKPLPACDAFLPVLTSLGMSEPQPQRTPSGDLLPAQRHCSFAIHRRATTADILSASVSANLPHIDPDEGVTVKRWGEMWLDKPCDGLQRPAASIARGTICYTTVGTDSGSVHLLGLPDDIGIAVRMHWWDPGADETSLREDAEQKAEALAQHLIAML